MLKHRLFSGFFALAIFLTVHAAAQESEQIGDGEKAQSQTEKNVFKIVRAHRALSLTLAIPWNGLIGIGPILSFYPDPHLGIDAGVGLGGTGFKYGARLRYLFTAENVTPFVGAGFMSGSGTGDGVATVNSDNNPISFKLAPTSFFQFLGGVDIITNGGFMFMGGLGYAACLNKNNITIVHGTPTDAQNKAMDIVYHGGLVIALDIGFAFKIK